MQKVRRLRAMGLLCRQQAAYNPAQSWKLLAEAEYWEHLAHAEASSHFEECNTTSSSDSRSPSQLLMRMTRDGDACCRVSSLMRALGGFYRAEEGVKGNATY